MPPRVLAAHRGGPLGARRDSARRGRGAGALLGKPRDVVFSAAMARGASGPSLSWPRRLDASGRGKAAGLTACGAHGRRTDRKRRAQRARLGRSAPFWGSLRCGRGTVRCCGERFVGRVAQRAGAGKGASAAWRSAAFGRSARRCGERFPAAGNASLQRGTLRCSGERSVRTGAQRPDAGNGSAARGSVRGQGGAARRSGEPCAGAWNRAAARRRCAAGRGAVRRRGEA
jgi:hypothetical protein